MLLAWDRWLFLGHDPAVLLHHALGTHAAAVVLADGVRDGAVLIASLVCVWILGVASYYAIPSLGPFHSAPGAFSSLPHTMMQDTQARYLAPVSAFASLHVAVTATLVLMAAHYRLRRTTVVLSAYLAVVMVATVYLGWHFAVDVLAGLAIAVVGVWLGKRIARPRGNPADVSADYPLHV
jgi:membrane-associated phospholipid phosphatase